MGRDDIQLADSRTTSTVCVSDDAVYATTAPDQTTVTPLTLLPIRTLQMQRIRSQDFALEHFPDKRTEADESGDDLYAGVARVRGYKRVAK